MLSKIFYIPFLETICQHYGSMTKGIQLNLLSFYLKFIDFTEILFCILVKSLSLSMSLPFQFDIYQSDTIN